MEQKAKAIQFFKTDHQKLVKVVKQLNEGDMVGRVVQGEWTVKDVIAHISAWHWEVLLQVNRVLNNQTPWYVKQSEREFNQHEVEKRKSWTLQEVLFEWQDSFDALISRIEELSAEEFNYKMDASWPDGSPITVKSLFGYRYKGAGHEGGHAIQIRKNLLL